MNKIYWWAQNQNYTDLKLLHESISEGKFIYLWFDNYQAMYLLNKDTVIRLEKDSSNQEFIHIWNFYCGWKNSEGINFAYIKNNGHIIYDTEQFNFKTITQDEFNSLIRKNP